MINVKPYLIMSKVVPGAQKVGSSGPEDVAFQKENGRHTEMKDPKKRWMCS